MKKLIAKRLARTLPLIVLISIVTFSLLHLAPGGPAGVYSGSTRMSESDLARVRANLGVDRPLPVQYFLWFKKVFLGFDFGTSYVTGQPVALMIRDRLPATLELMGTAFILAVLLGLSTGVVSALRRDGLLDQIISVISAGGLSVPVFWLGIIAIYIFSLKLGVLPSGGRETIGAQGGPADHIRHLVLPACVLSIGFFASWSRYTRAQLLDAIRGDFVRTARAKGLSETAVIWKHALRNALIAPLTVAGMLFANIITGAVILENVFAWPGLGKMSVDSMIARDFPVVQGITLLVAALVLMVNLLVDITYAYVDPQIRYQNT